MPLKTEASPSAPQTIIVKKKIRAPQRNGQSLIHPPANQSAAIWDQNRTTLGQHQFTVDGQSIQALRATARQQLIAAAVEYSSRYRDVPAPRFNEIIMSGHQPRLFHPGVWFKNFAISELGTRRNATALNLIVDNDLCGLSSEPVPKDVSPTEATTTSIPYDSPGGNLPFESRKIGDRNVFDSFAKKVSAAIKGTVEFPIIEQLWKDAPSWVDPQLRLGHSIAAARHRLEGLNQLNTLELPLSTVCQTQSFASFASEILNRLEEFHQIYNQSLFDYREAYRIRSNSHPVPELEQQDDWYETPFWIWSDENPVRKALFVQRNHRHVILSNRSDLEIRLSPTQLAQQLHELSEKHIAVRPRALITTMYSRLILSDLFIHGIGGSQYDQLTDAIINRFWGCVPPKFLTITATLKLPFQFERVTKQDIINDQQTIRELRFHPEKHIATPDPVAQQLIDTKQEWVDKKLPRGTRKERHDSIEECNQKLRDYTQDLIRQVQEKRAARQRLLARSRILDARGYSFCCFDSSLIGQLKSMASMTDQEAAK